MALLRFNVVAGLMAAPLLVVSAQSALPGDKLVGTWVSKASSGENDQYWTIRNDAGKWSVQGLYKTGDEETGSFVGEKVTFDGKVLRYTHKYVKKPGKGADNVPVTIESEGDRLRYSWTVKDVTKKKLLDRVADVAQTAPTPAGSSEPKTDLDPAGQKLVGTLAALVDRTFLTVLTVSYEQGAWSVSGLFKENGKDIGGFEGADVQYAKGVLTFKQQFFRKPRPDWKDDEKFTLRVAGNGIVGLPDRAGAPIRSFERIDVATSAAPAAGLKRDDPKRFVGTYRGTANDGTKGLLLITEIGGNLTYHATWYSSAGKVIGTTVGVDVRVADGNLQLTQRHLKKPHPGWHDNTTVKLEMVQNTLTQTRQEGNRWAPSATFTRAAR
jgi:hypothetical protein